MTSLREAEAAVFDVLVVGAGAAGAAVSLRLAEKGLRVGCIEQGNWVDRTELPKQFLDWESRGRHWWNANPSIRRWRADYPVTSVGESVVEPSLYNAVGGSTIGFAGIYWRLVPSDFKTKSLDGFGVDWPIGYHDLAPYYTLNEKLVGVSGLAGDPTMPPLEQELPLPPVDIGKIGRRWAEGFAKLGWYWWPQACAISTRDYGEHRRECIGRGYCRYGCPSAALGTVDVAYWPNALAAGVQLITTARVREVDLDDRGRARGVVALDDDGVEFRLEAPVIVVCCGGVGTPRLLLMSASKRHPDGLANSSGLVGKNLMLHVQTLVVGRFEDRVDGDGGAWGGTVSSRHFYETDPSNDFIRGFTLGARRGMAPLATALGVAPWGVAHHAAMEEHLNHEGVITVMGDDEPEDVNRVELDQTRSDEFGLPGMALHYRLSENSRRLGEEGIRRGVELCQAAGAVATRTTGLVPAGAPGHLMGTARMGSDRSSAVVDADHRSFDVPNLFIVDGSSMPTGGSVNPTHTIQALALRAADRIFELRHNVI